MTTTATDAPADRQLQRAIIGYRLTQALGVAAQLGIADLLADGPRSCDDLARVSGSSSDALHRLLRLLASEGVFQETAPRQFALTPMAALLRAEVPGSMRARAIIEATEWAAAWARLSWCVGDGRPAFERVYGAPPFRYYAENPEAASLFNAAMTSMTTRVSAAIVAAYDFSGLTTIVDVGGGHGTLLAAILAANPRASGILFDLPAVVEGARPTLAAAGVADRCQLVAGDFFTNVPPGEAYVLKFIMDDWGDADAVRLLQACRRAMRPESRLLIVEMLIPPGNEPFYGKWTDVNMLVMLGGRERTESEYGQLLATAGLELRSVRPTSSDFSILEASPR